MPTRCWCSEHALNTPVHRDANATIPVVPGAAQAIIAFVREAFGNPSCAGGRGRTVSSSEQYRRPFACASG